MMKEVKIPLAHTKKGTITMVQIDQPYGPKSTPVVSIGISVAGGDTPDYKIHLPYENLEAVIENLQVALRNSRE